MRTKLEIRFNTKITTEIKIGIRIKLRTKIEIRPNTKITIEIKIKIKLYFIKNCNFIHILIFVFIFISIFVLVFIVIIQKFILILIKH